MTTFSDVRAVASTVLLLGLSTMGTARHAEAQIVPYAGLGVERAAIQGPPIEGLAGTSGLRFVLLAGLTLEAPNLAQGLEVELGWLDEQRKQVGWTPQQGEAPVRLGLTAWTLKGSYRLQPPVRRWPLRPFLRLGGSWGRLTDASASDTPTERTTSHLWGAHAGGGVETRLGRGLWLSLTGDYLLYADSGDRPALALGLGRWAFSGRIGVTL